MSPLEITLMLALGSLMVAVVGFFLKRMVSSVDGMGEKVQAVCVELKDRPTWEDVKKMAVEVTEHQVTEHERDYHAINMSSGSEEFNQLRKK